MKAEELMVGDWVFNAHHGENIQITPYDFFTHGHFKEGKYIPTGVTPSNGWDLEPIPLTPEILEKNFGSALNGGGYFEGDEFYELMIHEVNDGTWIIKHDNIEFSNIPRQQVMVSYVHELQHALRLCGIDKEITI